MSAFVFYYLFYYYFLSPVCAHLSVIKMFRKLILSSLIVGSETAYSIGTHAKS